MTTLRLTSSVLALSFSAFFTPSAIAQTTDEPEAMDEIIVTGTPLGRAVNDSLIGASFIRGEELSQRLAGSIGETLKAEPGISSTFFGPGASRPIIRGQGGDRIRVLDNGIGTIDAAATSPDHATALEPAMAERIEIVRGAGVLRYGSSGAAGVVNIFDGRIPSRLPDGVVSGGLRVGGSSVDNGLEGAGAVQFRLDGDADATSGWVAHIEAAARKTEDYDIPGFAESARLRAIEEMKHDDEDDDHEEEEEEVRDTLTNSFTEASSVAAGLSYVGDFGHIGVAVKTFDSLYGIPGGHEHEEGEEEDEEEEEEEGGITIDIEQVRYDLNGEIALSGSTFEKLNIFGGFANFEQQELEPSGEVGTVFTNDGFEARAELIQRQSGPWKAAYGAQVRGRTFSAIGEEAFVPPTESRQYGIFTFQEYETGNFHIEGAARYETTSQESDLFTRNFDSVSVSAGADYHMSDAFRFGGTIYRTQRAPTTEELFSNGPHLATSQFELGDPDLDVETALGIEGAVRFKFGETFLTANLFYTDYQDYIFETATGEEEDGLPVFQYLARDASFRGFEIDAGTHLANIGPWDVNVDGVIEYVETEVDFNDGVLPRIPPLGILAGIEADTGHIKLRAEVDHIAKQDDITAFELPTDASTQINAFLTWRPYGNAEPLLVRISALNLTDEEVRQHTSFLKELAPLPGRKFKIAFETKF